MAWMAEFVINSSDIDLLLTRPGLVDFFGSLDAKRPTAWLQYGYDSELSFQRFYTAYKRTGLGHGAVHSILDKCWQQLPRIKQPKADEETGWETKVKALIKGCNGWQKLRDFDRRNMVGRFAGLVYRFADGKQLNEPLSTGVQRLVDIVPLYENQIRVLKWNEDPTSEDYGKPDMFQIETAPPSEREDQARPRTWLKVHPSRMQILAEGAVGDNFFDGVPLLEAGFNALVDFEKLRGGGAEGALKNSQRTTVLKFDKDADPKALTQNPDGTPSSKTVGQAADEKMSRLNRNLDASIVLQGGEATTLQTTVSDLGPQAQIVLSDFAASVRYPMTMLIGQQTGRLASDEDKSAANARCKSRQQNELTPMLEQFVRNMQKAGLIDAGDFEIEWPPLDAPGDDAKATLLGKLTAAMKQAFDAGLTEPLFDANELRAVIDYEERDDDGMPEEGDPAADDPAVDPKAPVPTPAPAPRRVK